MSYRNRNVNIIVGVGFGDEGKGVATSFLTSEAIDPLNVRFCGGHQVGHTVVKDGVRHVFSNFGSGTLNDVPTYFSEYCTVDPLATLREGSALIEKGYTPIVYYNGNAMVTTPFDVYVNQKREKELGHGSVGVGFGTTIQRNEDHFKLFVRDLKYPQIRDAKLRNIAKYYNLKIESELITNFKHACDLLVSYHMVVNSLDEAINDGKFYDLVFEGSQGILLDQDYGFFPNVTRSYTTSRNVFEILKTSKLAHGDAHTLHTYYISRVYQTRHGNGFMTNLEHGSDFIKNNPFETNVLNEYQGEFRKSVLDIDLIRYAVECDSYHNTSGGKYLFLTCLDQVDDKAIPITYNGELSKHTHREIPHLAGLAYDYGYYSYSDNGDIRRD